MRKLKKILATIFTGLTLALCALVSVNAAENADLGLHEVWAKDFYTKADNTIAVTGSTKTAPTKTTVDIISTTTDKNLLNAFKTYKSSVTNNTGIAFDYEFVTGGTRNFTVALGENQTATVKVYAYDNGTDKTIKIGKGDAQDVTNVVAKAYEGELDATNNIIVCNGSNICLLKIEVTVSGSSAAPATYDVTYDLNGGTASSTVTNPTGLAKNTQITLPVLTKEGYDFNGWTVSDGTKLAANATTYTVTKNVTITANWKKANLTNTLDQSNLTVVEEISSDLEYALDSIYTFTPNMQVNADANYTLPDGTTSAMAINTRGKSFNSATQKRVIKFTAPANGMLKVWFASTDATRKLDLLSGDATSLSKPLFQKTISQASVDNKQAKEVVFDLTGGTSYQIAAEGGALLIFKIEFTAGAQINAINDSIALNSQPSTDNTSVRFIVTLTTTDLASLDRIELELTLNHASAPITKKEVIKTVYTSISGLAGFGEKDNTYYAVIVLTGVSTANTYGYTGITGVAKLYEQASDVTPSKTSVSKTENFVVA